MPLLVVALQRPGFDAPGRHAAAEAGTALNTLVDRGVYPDPRYGLNNTAIACTLARQDYWYRMTFEEPAASPTKS